MFPELHLGDLVAKKAIIQGGMGVGISWSKLASAVAKEGGIGVISTVLIGANEPDIKNKFAKATERALRREINIARKYGVIGANIMVALTNFKQTVEICIDENIDIIFSGAGLPLDLPSYLKPQTKTKLVPIVSSARAANLIKKRWETKYNYTPDAFVVEGPLAGGHLGFKKEQIISSNLEEIIPQVLKVANDIPIIAAGGIYSGEDIYKFIKMGCSGVQLGTRFVATHECDANIKFKEAYINAKKEDIKIVESPVKMPARALRNDFVKKMEDGKTKPLLCSYNCIKTCNHKDSKYCIIKALINAQRGILKDQGLIFVGDNVDRIDKIISVKELILNLIEEYENECRTN